MTSPSFAAVDLGAESGRVMLGSLRGDRLHLQEVHRFPNGGVRLGSHLYWDLLRLWREIQTGLQKAAAQPGLALRSIGLDSWGVDFGLLDAHDKLIANPYHYRDSHTDGVMAAVFEIVPQAQVYAQTGIQFMQLNSLYQLFAMVQAHDPALAIAKTFLNIPDLFNFFLTGVKASEFTIATTTQCYNPLTRGWAFELLAALGIPTQIFGEIIPAGTLLGPLRPALAAEWGLAALPVVACAGHDTASAVVATPAIAGPAAGDHLYLSSGTWSLMGVELDAPRIDSASLAANMTNEGGFDHKIRFLKNIVGLWMVQECRRLWARRGAEYTYQQLSEMALAAPAFGALLNPADACFLAPADMVVAIQSCCRQTGQPVPAEPAAILRCIFESLTLEYRRVADQIDRLTAKKHPVIHIIGGGSQNGLLNQWTANATGKTVIAGPAEATAIGNLLVQAIALGEIASLAEGRALVRHSCDLAVYQPQDAAAWEAAYARFLALAGT
jgi:rhamnulokinase